MTTNSAIELMMGAVLVWGKTVGPMLLAALVVGVLVGVLQAATQINEASISFISKLVAVGVTFVALGAWSVQGLIDYTQTTIASIATVIR